MAEEQEEGSVTPRKDFKLDCELMELPPGFRFHPTDEEIITHYLTPKTLTPTFTARAIADADFNKCEPWDLPKRANMGEKEWYFFCQKDRKYPTGTRTNRATQSGYWKATGKDKEVYRGKRCVVGMKKTLVFYRGRAPRGEKTNWVMHEYRLDQDKKLIFPNSSASKDEWAVCRIFHKNAAPAPGIKRTLPNTNHSTSISRMNSFGFGDDVFFCSSSPSLPPLLDDAPDSNNTSGVAPTAPTAPSDRYFSFFPDQKYNASNNNNNNNNNNNIMSNYSTSFQAFINSPTSYEPSAAAISPKNLASETLSDLPPKATHPPLYYYPTGAAYVRGHPLPGYIGSEYVENRGHRGAGAEHLSMSSNQHSMVTVSQETGLSMEVNTTEISSSAVVSQIDDDDGHDNHRPFEDLECLWDC